MGCEAVVYAMARGFHEALLGRVAVDIIDCLAVGLRHLYAAGTRRTVVCRAGAKGPKQRLRSAIGQGGGEARGAGSRPKEGVIMEPSDPVQIGAHRCEKLYRLRIGHGCLAGSAVGAPRSAPESHICINAVPDGYKPEHPASLWPVTLGELAEGPGIAPAGMELHNETHWPQPGAASPPSTPP